LEPLILRQIRDDAGGYEYQVVAGRRRFVVASELGLADVPARVIVPIPDFTPKTIPTPKELEALDQLIAFEENDNRVEEHPWSLALKAAQMVREGGFSQAQVAEVVRKKSKSTVNDMLYAVNKLPDEWKDRIRKKGENLFAVVVEHKEWLKAQKQAKEEGKEPPEHKEWKAEVKEAEKRAREEAKGENGKGQTDGRAESQNRKTTTGKKACHQYEGYQFCDRDTGLSLVVTGGKKNAPPLQNVIHALKKYLSILEGEAKNQPAKQELTE
jgi:ParB/RepB/Spo0J family partition protein